SHALWKIAFWHQTPYTTNHHLDDHDPIDVAARQFLNPIVERYGVQLVLTGHEHNYQRTRPLRSAYGDISTVGNFVTPAGQGAVHVASGGGGGVLHPVAAVTPSFLVRADAVYHYLRVDVNSSQITVHAIAVDSSIGPPGTEFDSFSISLPPALGQGTPVVNAASFQP